MRLTKEQANIAKFKGSLLVVMAYAGSGKTATLIEYAKANPNIRMLYVAYNRAISEEAQSKFPENVICRTSHQLAHARFRKKYQHKFRQNLSINMVLRELGDNNWKLAKDVIFTLEQYLCSANKHVQVGHTPQADTPESMSVPERRYRGELVAYATSLWEKMKDESNSFPITHDGLLKLYQLSKPDLSIYFGAILFDEAQDANPVTTDFILRQNCKKLFVGDRHQQIYRYRGANNALDAPEMKSATRMYLSNCFRFGPEIAMVANSILHLKNEEVFAVGRGGKGELLSSLPQDQRHFALLGRTVHGVIQAALSLANKDKKIFWVGGIRSYGIGMIADVLRLKEDKTSNIKNVLVQQFSSFHELKRHAQSTENFEVLRAIKLVELPHFAVMLQKLAQQTVEHEYEADYTVSTAHRSKGLEWENVALLNDFPDVFALEGDEYEDELNLLYVAATRAKKSLVINHIVEACMRKLLYYRNKNNP